MKTVLYESPFVPAEWIAAHGLRPMRIAPALQSGAPSIFSGIGLCPYARAFIDTACASKAHAIVVTTTCDQMRRAAELIEEEIERPVFLMHVPTTWQTPGAQKYYVNELLRLGRFLVELKGQSPSSERLAEVMREYDAARRDLRALRGSLSARGFSEAIKEFNRSGMQEHKAAKVLEDPRWQRGVHCSVPLALVGGPLLANHFDIFDVVESAGGQIVLDATTTGERTLPAPLDSRALEDDPLLALADAYFGGIPDAFRRPNSELYVYLKREFAERGVRGVIFRNYVWCDTWHAEAERMKEWCDLPFLALEAGDEDHANGHLSSRIQAFLEMLK